jgi:hypothetical protein
MNQWGSTSLSICQSLQLCILSVSPFFNSDRAHLNRPNQCGLLFLRLIVHDGGNFLVPLALFIPVLQVDILYCTRVDWRDSVQCPQLTIYHTDVFRPETLATPIYFLQITTWPIQAAEEWVPRLRRRRWPPEIAPLHCSSALHRVNITGTGYPGRLYHWNRGSSAPEPCKFNFLPALPGRTPQ